MCLGIFVFGQLPAFGLTASVGEKKNDINIPLIQGEERELLLEKRSKLKALTDYLENIVNTSEDKSTIDRPFIEKQIKKFHKPTRISVAPTEESFFDVMRKYLSTHKLSVARQKNFKVIMRSLCRFELFKKKEGHRGFKMSFANLSVDILHQIEDFLGNEKDAFLKYPDIYEEIPYSTKVAVKTPKENVHLGWMRTVMKFPKVYLSLVDKIQSQI